MNTDRQCPLCGKSLPPDVPAGLCPQCLLETAAPTLTGSTWGGRAAFGGLRPAPGENFGGYRILRLLGKGGMGEVWEAEQAESGRRVALKVMHHALLSEDDRKRFLREGRLAASVSHPNVVYVYGSEEIEGSPVIAMELAREGTLRELVARRGPLPVVEAVDLILQVLAGLEEANAAGVLHRDIKPGNCFLGEDGVVKVGDFGLSISTLAMGESMLTAAGSVYGTPSFASPEQLRGEELDVRSDIYSVGATLYLLVTGHAPIEGGDLVKLIPAVLDQPPVPPRVHQPELPPAFARILLRCLSKNRSARYANYAELARALAPYGSDMPSPALLGKRLIAGIIDEFVVIVPALILSATTGLLIDERFLVERDLLSVLMLVGSFVLSVLYYGLCEYRWGAGLGKMICGLRVTAPGAGGPGFWQAFRRAFVFKALWAIPVLYGFLAYSGAEVADALTKAMPLASDWLEIGMFVVLFLTARRRNGFAGLHDLASGTRVVAAPRREGRAAVDSGASEEVPDVLPEHVGPYGVIGTLSRSGDGSRLDLAFDPVLRRNVWLHRVPDNSPLVPEGRRNLNRATRLRWLNGRREAGVSWDAYEAPGGQSFLEMTRMARPWSAVRHWLADLADEFHAGNRRGVPASFAEKRVWIARNGRALVLDFPAPGADALPSPDAPGAPDGDGSLAAHQRFLSALAAKALGTGPRGRSAGAPPTLAAQSFLANLRAGGFESIEMLLGNLKSLVERPARLPSLLRIATILFPVAVALVFPVAIALELRSAQRKWERAWNENFPGEPPLADAVRVVEAQWSAFAFVDENAVMHPLALEASRKLFPLQVYAGVTFGDILDDDRFWRHPDLGQSLSEPMRAFLIDAREIARAATPQEADTARAAAKSLLEEQQTSLATISFHAALVIFTGLLLAFAFLSLLFLLVLGQPPLLRLLGLVVIDRGGRPAARGRLALRWLLGWGVPVAAVLILAAYVGGKISGVHTIPLVGGVGIPLVAGLFFLWHLAASPWRGWHDALSGTRVTLR